MKTFYSSGKKLSEEITEYFKGSVSYSLANKLIRKKDVKVNGIRVKEDVKTLAGDKIEVYYDGEDSRANTVIYKDDNVLVVYKPSGITSEDFYSLLCKKHGEVGFIHRLDQNTDGVMIFSLNQYAEKELLNGFKRRTFDKYYLAEVVGTPEKPSAELTAYLVKDSEKSEVKVFDRQVEKSEKIVTSYTVLRSSGETSLLEVKLITGKTHQIRAHLAHVGHFIVGDGKYGYESVNRKFKAKKQRLTAYKLILAFDRGSAMEYLNGKEFTCKASWLKI
ncbi:MAG: RluA family pseudouridine synthase [Clostridia bacterium]|nr:RluA family pseudouridine synthase [Clostridia bacterium]